MPKAIALFSGGLDSTLAVLAVMKQGIDVQAVRFLTPFDPDTSARASFSEDAGVVAGETGFDVTVHRLDETFLDIVKNPPHGHGKNMNPCIDCRILMLRNARAYMERVEADFIVTGEVLGQRPMSQRKDMLYHIDKEAGVSGYVVRPLSAKFLAITVPEAEGMIDREKLYGFSGRSRKPQMTPCKGVWAQGLRGSCRGLSSYRTELCSQTEGPPGACPIACHERYRTPEDGEALPVFSSLQDHRGKR